jgi:actin-related protein
MSGHPQYGRALLIEPASVGIRDTDKTFPLRFETPVGETDVKSVWKSSESNGSLELSDDDTLLSILMQSFKLTTSGNETLEGYNPDNAVLISEPSLQNNAYRQKVVQLLFEKLGCRGAFVCKRSVLSAFSVGKITALVVSVGAGVSNVSCIVGGHSNAHLSANWNTAGNAIDKEIIAKLRSQNSSLNFLPKSFLDAPITSSYRNESEKLHVRRLKEEVCRVSENKDLRVSVGNAAYELPDGTLVDCSKIAQSVPELLFTNTAKNIPSMVNEVIVKCKTSDESLAQSILVSVVVSGGTTAMTGFNERIHNDLSVAYKGFAPVVKCQSGPDPSESAWVGGSIVASLGNFSSLWITKREYEEHGVGIVGKKCP